MFRQTRAKRLYNITFRSGDTPPFSTQIPIFKITGNTQLLTFLNSLTAYTNSTITQTSATVIINDEPIIQSNPMERYKNIIFTYEIKKPDGSQIDYIKVRIPNIKNNINEENLNNLLMSKIGKWTTNDIVTRIN